MVIRHDLLTFVEAKPFTAMWAEMKLSVDALFELQALLLDDPRVGEVVQGTGSLRKLRFVPTSWHKGKSGALRVCYVYFHEYGIRTW